MSEVLANEQVAEGVYRLAVAGQFAGTMGQFYMLRAWDHYPLLSRPLSIFNVTAEYVEFLYLVAGEGTEMFSKLRKGDSISLEGPLGNGFSRPSGKTAFVGGGIGIAPFYYALGQIPDADVYLGFSREAYMVDEFRAGTTGQVVVNVGGIILDEVDFNAYDTIIACGPHKMLEAVQRKQADSGTKAEVYVSLENRMACGIGACLVCSVQCRDGRKKACADGPVFRAEEVVFA
ncbi:dihydroorotate dehydrogenase electron transfer subunit [Paenibacillus sp. Marseille-P2973]|uniref:dihydroorotate dehydrogenase electron transfer subunit n=1 Tax=Paenibacillus sp. Marseille-P2973 TaxID=1871032 RepID=UPI001B368660|nr:dihydroorotate dehydrogenase electron transfer subunit [Paenibacillus sp. Marseille-P2973]MBQ4898162.1 dihydroorotate dehydrogenase electron transfer subunit [Paenibacillus sp. Marseille-P2973]